MSARFVLSASPGAVEEWVRKFTAANYEEITSKQDTETRLLHPKGSCVRIFKGEDLDRCYIYPPGGTTQPTGKLVIPQGLLGVEGVDQLEV